MPAGPRPVDGDFADSHLRSRTRPAQRLPGGWVAGDAAVAVNFQPVRERAGGSAAATDDARLAWATWRSSWGRAARLAGPSPVQLALGAGGRSAACGRRCWDARGVVSCP